MQIASGRPEWARSGKRNAVRLALSVAFIAVSLGVGCRRRHGADGRSIAANRGPAARVTVALAGRVLDRGGRAVPDARVLLFSEGANGDPIATSTDLEGAFHASALVPGRYRLIVEAAGFPTAERDSVAVPGDQVSVALDGQGRLLRGRVERNGAPVADARILLAPDEGGPTREALSRAAGAFAFAGLGHGRYALRAVADRAASRETRGIEATDDGHGPEVRLSLEPGHSIDGRVMDDAAVGLSGVEVRVEMAGPAGDDPLPTVVRTNAGGRFSAGPVAPGTYRLVADRSGYLPRRAPTIEVHGDAAPAPVTLELVRGARLSGRARDGSGGPAVGARVRCAASAFEDLTVQTGTLPLAAEAAALPSGTGRALGTTRVTVVAGDGRFTVSDLVPGRYHVDIALNGAEPFQSGELLLAPGEHRDLGTVSLRAGIPLDGRVLDESGAPIEGVRVRVTGGSTGSPGASLDSITDGGGRFTFALSAGAWRVVATASGRGSAETSVELAFGGKATSLELRLGRTEARLEGLVRDDGGRPLGRARITVFPADSTASPVGSGTTDPGGHFAITSLPAGDLRLEVHHPDYPVTTTIAPSGQFAIVTVPFPGGVAGEVRVRGTGATVPRARVTATGPGGATALAEVRKTGSFDLLHLAPGRWRLTVSASGYRPVEREVDVTAGSTLGEASLRDLRFELDPS